MSPKSKRIVIIGASGHGKVACEAAESQGYEIVGFLDSNLACGKEVLGYRVIGKPVDILILSKKYNYIGYFVAISNNYIRAVVSEQVTELASELLIVSIIHRQSIVSKRAKIEEGVLILAGAIVNSDCVVKKGAIINTLSLKKID